MREIAFVISRVCLSASASEVLMVLQGLGIIYVLAGISYFARFLIKHLL